MQKPPKVFKSVLGKKTQQQLRLDMSNINPVTENTSALISPQYDPNNVDLQFPDIQIDTESPSVRRTLVLNRNKEDNASSRE